MGISLSNNRSLRVGVFGINRGMSFSKNAKLCGMELVAICDTWEEKLKEANEGLKVATYTDFDEFIEHEMDAVILANYFHEHAPFAIKALNSGKHVMSETMACKTISEGIKLIQAVEKSRKIFMLAENYPFFAYNQEMKRLYQAGEIGEIQYGEGEYNHPCDSTTKNQLAPGRDHWRNHIPATYYCSHALAPLLYITNTSPISVNSLCIPFSDKDSDNMHVRVNDIGSVILCKMDNDSVLRIMGLGMRGHSIWYRILGTRGAMENLRYGDTSMLRVVHEEWDMKQGDVKERIFTPEFQEHGDIAKKSGHFGGDFYTNYYFAKAICENRQPYFDVYKGVEMALVAIQSYKSALSGGAPYEIPDLRSGNIREKFKHDNWSPWPEDRSKGQPWPSVKGEIKPSKEASEYARKVWCEMGYKGE